MSICGIDFGNLNILIAHAAKGGVDMVLNDASMRNTASYVSVQGKQRFVGDNAASLARTNIKNTLSLMKLLVGRNYDEEEVQRELARSYFQHTKLPSGGVGIIINYNDEPTVVSAEHMMAVLLVKCKQGEVH